MSWGWEGHEKRGIKALQNFRGHCWELRKALMRKVLVRKELMLSSAHRAIATGLVPEQLQLTMIEVVSYPELALPSIIGVYVYRRECHVGAV